MTIEVKVKDLDTYTCTPARKDKDRGTGTITWALKSKGYRFVSPYVTWGTPTPASAPQASDVFEAPVPDKDRTSFSVVDNNFNGSGNTHYDYPYTLYIETVPSKQDAKHRKSTTLVSARLVASDPIIRNQPK